MGKPTAIGTGPFSRQLERSGGCRSPQRKLLREAPKIEEIIYKIIKEDAARIAA
jgi:hypothetical protein